MFELQRSALVNKGLIITNVSEQTLVLKRL